MSLHMGNLVRGMITGKADKLLSEQIGTDTSLAESTVIGDRLQIRRYFYRFTTVKASDVLGILVKACKVKRNTLKINCSF